MERGVDSEEKVPQIVQVMYFNQLPRQAVPQNSNQQPENVIPQQWDTQWQEFLKTLQPAQPGIGNPQVVESAPWEDAKTFLSSFEEVAETCQWPQDEWVGRLLPALRGGVKQCLWRLNARDRRDYGKVKSAILRDDAIRTESRRQHFRQCGYQEGPRNIYRQLQELCRQWLKPDKRSKEQILELIIQEQLLAMLPPEVQRKVKECGPGDCTETVALAENFLMNPQTAWTQERPVPLPEGTVSSREMEGVLPNIALRQFCAGINRTGDGEIGLMTNEVTSLRNSGVVHPPVGLVTTGAGLGEVSVNVTNMALDKARCPAEDLDQKPSPWELMQQTFGNANVPEGLLIPTPDSISQPEQPETQRPGETLPDSLSGGRMQSEIKAESSDETDVDDDMPVLSPEEYRDNGSVSPAPTTERELRPRKPQEEQQGIVTRQQKRKATGFSSQNKYNTKEKRFECPQCNHRTYYLSDLLKHMESHSGKRPYRCLECGRSFSKEESYREHQRVHISTGGAGGKKKVNQSLSNQQGPKVYRCTTCRFKAISLKHLTEHMRVHLGEKLHKCTECGRVFRWVSNLSRHQKLHSIRKNLGVRQLIHRGTEGLGKLKNHSLQHYKIRLEDALDTSSDTVADGREPSVSSRLRPRKRLRQETSYDGDIQQEGYESEDLLKALQSRPLTRFRSRRHQRKGPGASRQLGRAAVAVKRSINYGKKKKHACQLCEYRSERLSDVVKHMKVHTKERPYNCSECGITFRWLSNYTNHKKVCVSSQRNPEATVAECDVTLSDEEELINILQKNSQPRGKRSGVVGTSSKLYPMKQRGREHQSKSEKYKNKERNHECTICGHRAFYLSDLVRHLRIHTREKPYKCNQCGKAFAQKSTLVSHKKNCKPDSASSSVNHKIQMPSSGGEKKYSCSRCGYAAMKLTTLLKHMNIHMGERTYKCKECGETFAWKSNLCKHQRTHTLDAARNETKILEAGHQEMNSGNEPSKVLEENSQQERTELTMTSSTSPGVAQEDVSLTVGDKSSEDQGTTPEKGQAKSDKRTEGSTVGKDVLKLLNLEQFAYFKGDKSSEKQSEPVVEQLVTVKEEPCEIPVCEKNHSIAGSLMKYQNDEEEEKPVICSDCGRCFSMMAQLRRHSCVQPIHTRVKLYLCSVCGQTLRSDDAFVTHMKTHDTSTTADAPTIETARTRALDDALGTSDRTDSSSDKTES